MLDDNLIAKTYRWQVGITEAISMNINNLKYCFTTQANTKYVF